MKYVIQAFITCDVTNEADAQQLSGEAFTALRGVRRNWPASRGKIIDIIVHDPKKDGES